MVSSVSSVVYASYDPEDENVVTRLRAVAGPLPETLGGTAREDLSGLFSSIGNVPVTYNNVTRQFIVDDVTGVDAEITFTAIRDAIASGSGEIVFNGDFKTSSGGRFLGSLLGDVSGNLSGTATSAQLAGSATSALSATEATLVRNVRFNGVTYNLSSNVDVTVTAGTAVVDFTSVSSALFSATDPISINGKNINNVGTLQGSSGRFTNDVSSESVSGTNVRGGTVNATTSFSGPAATITNFTGTNIRTTNLSATGNVSGETLTIAGNTTLAALTGTIARFTTSVSSNSASAITFNATNVTATNFTGTDVRATNLSATGNVSGAALTIAGNSNFGPLTATTGSFTSEVSTALVKGDTVSGTNIASLGNITSQVGTIQGPNVYATNQFSGAGLVVIGDVSTTTGTITAANIRGTTSVSSNSATATTFNATTGNIITVNATTVTGTNVTGTNVEGTTSVKGGTVSALISFSGPAATITNFTATNATATNFTGTDVRATTQFSGATLTIAGNTTLAALTGTTGRFTTSVSSNSATATTFNATTGNITTVNATNVTGASVTATNFTATNNVTVTGDISTTTGTITAANIRGTTSVSSNSATAISLTATTGNITTVNATTVTATNFTGTDVRATTQFSGAALTIAGNSNLGPLTATTGRFTTEVSTGLVMGDIVSGTNIVSEGDITSQVGTIKGPNVSSTNATAISLTATTGNIITVNATTVTATTVTGTNVTGTNVEGTTSVKGGTVSALNSFSGPNATITNFTGTNVRATTQFSGAALTIAGNTNLAAVTATGNISGSGTLEINADSTLKGDLFLTDAAKQIVNQGTLINVAAATFGNDVTLSGSGKTFKVGTNTTSGSTVLLGHFSALVVSDGTQPINTATPGIQFNSTAGTIRSAGNLSLQTIDDGAAINIGTQAVTKNIFIGEYTKSTIDLRASGDITLSSKGNIILDPLTGSLVSGNTLKFTTISATTISATNYQGFAGGGGGISDASSIKGVPVTDPISTYHKRVLTYVSGPTESLEWEAKVGQVVPGDSIGSMEVDSQNAQLAVATSGGGSFIVSGMPDGTFLVASGGSVVPAYLPSYMLRYFGTNGTGSWGSPISNPAEVLNAEGQFLYYDATNQRYTNTGNLKVVGNNNLTATNVSATTVSATNYRNIRPYVSAVDSSTTTSVNISGDYDTYLVNTTTTSVTLYLPDASAWTSKQITVSKIDDGGSYRSVTLSGTTLQTATNTVRLYDPTESVTVISNGTNWYSLDYDRAYGVVVVAKNSTGSTLTKGTPVKVTGATGDNVLIGAVSAANNHVPQATDGNLTRCIGVVEHDIPNGEFGHVLTKGTLYKFNTNAYNEGDVLYLASGGGFTNVKPPAPYDEVFLGIVTRKQSVNGSILIDIANPIHINDIVGFNLASSLVNGDLISYDTTTSTFKNVQAVNVSGQGKFGSVSATNLSATNITATTYTGLPTSFDATSIVGLTVNPALGIGNPGDIFYWDGDINQFSMIGSGVLLAGAYVTSATSALNAQQAPNGLNVTGSVQITSDLTVSGKISSQKYPTYIYTATGISVAANKLMFDMFNGTGSGKTLKVTRIVAYVRNTTTITGINQVLECYRTSSVGTGGTTITESKMVTTDPNLNANITARNTPTGGAAYYIPSGVLAAANIYTEEGQNLQERVFLYVYDSFAGLEECLTLREGEGLRIITGAQGAAGVIAIYAYFITV
jgi:hypothetical protein